MYYKRLLFLTTRAKEFFFFLPVACSCFQFLNPKKVVGILFTIFNTGLGHAHYTYREKLELLLVLVSNCTEVNCGVFQHGQFFPDSALCIFGLVEEHIDLSQVRR